MTELYRCKVIENMQGKHLPTFNDESDVTHEVTEDFFYRGRKSLKIINSHLTAFKGIYFEKKFIRGKYKKVSFLAMGTKDKEVKIIFGIDSSPIENGVFTYSNVWQRFEWDIPDDVLENTEIEVIKIRLEEQSTIYVQDIILLRTYAGSELDIPPTDVEVFKILFPQGISAYEESEGMRFSRKQIPVGYGGIFQTTGSKGKEFSVSGMLHEKIQNTAGVIQPFRKLSKDIPYYLIDEGDFNNSIWYPVNITDKDIRKVPSAPYLWRFAIDMEEYTENDVP